MLGHININWELYWLHFEEFNIIKSNSNWQFMLVVVCVCVSVCLSIFFIPSLALVVFVCAMCSCTSKWKQRNKTKKKRGQAIAIGKKELHSWKVCIKIFRILDVRNQTKRKHIQQQPKEQKNIWVEQQDTSINKINQRNKRRRRRKKRRQNNLWHAGIFAACECAKRREKGSQGSEATTWTHRYKKGLCKCARTIKNKFSKIF